MTNSVSLDYHITPLSRRARLTVAPRPSCGYGGPNLCRYSIEVMKALTISALR